MICANCHQQISIETHGLFAGDLVSVDGAPHNLDCPAAGKHVRRTVTSRPCPTCGHGRQIETMNRKAVLRRCTNPACLAWTCQTVQFRGRARDLAPQLRLE